MSLSITYNFSAATKARASEVNQNFQDVAAKFNEGAGGISDGDISTTAGIRAIKLSTVAGNRITQAQMDDDAVDLRVLKDDATSGSPNAAVNTSDHIKDAIITNAKLVDGTLKKGKVALASVVVTIPGMTGPTSQIVTTGLLLSAALPITYHNEGGTSVGLVSQILFLDTDVNVRVWYWQIT